MQALRSAAISLAKRTRAMGTRRRVAILIGLLALISSATALVALTGKEKVRLSSAPPFNIIASVDGVVKDAPSIGWHAGPSSANGSPVMTFRSSVVDQYERQSKLELIRLLELLPTSHARLTPPSWEEGWQSDSLANSTKASLAKAILQLPDDGLVEALVVELIKSPAEELSSFEKGIIDSHKELAYLSFSELRQNLVDVAWEILVRNAVVRDQRTCDYDRFCPSNRPIPTLLLSPLENLLFDTDGRSSVLPADAASVRVPDVCGDYVGFLEKISKSAVTGKTQPNSSLYKNLISDESVVKRMQDECKNVNARLTQFSALVLEIRRLPRTPPEAIEASRKILRQKYAELGQYTAAVAQDNADKVIEAYGNYRTSLSAGQSKPILMQTLLSAYRPKFSFAGEFFNVRERDAGIQFLGYGNVVVSDKSLKFERPSLNFITENGMFDGDSIVSGSFAKVLSKIDFNRAITLQESAAKIFDADNAADFLLSEESNFKQREALRKEVYDRVVDAINEIAADRAKVLSAYAGGKLFPNEPVRISSSSVMPGEYVRQGQLVATAVPTRRWLISGKAGNWSNKAPQIGNHIVRLENSDSISFDTKAEHALLEIGDSDRDAFALAIRSKVSDLHYRLRINKVKKGLLVYEFEGWIEEIPPLMVSLPIQDSYRNAVDALEKVGRISLRDSKSFVFPFDGESLTSWKSYSLDYQ